MPATKPTRDILDNPHPPFPFPRVAFWILLLAVLAWLILELIGWRASAGWLGMIVLLIVVCLLFPPTMLTRRRGTKADDAPLREQIRQWREGGGGSR